MHFNSHLNQTKSVKRRKTGSTIKSHELVKSHNWYYLHLDQFSISLNKKWFRVKFWPWI